ncbi:MAG: hypothetical protein HYS27_02450 [Deltaproteobacteria bacterium]|nr:hypothetical protein [Deltaproteobacteria bacterium]
MFTLRCTQKLLKRLKTAPSPSPPAPTTVLGDWYANHVIVGRQHLVVCCSERTYLPVIVPARELASLPSRLTDALGTMLVALDVPEGALREELAAMSEVAIGKTASRVVVGVLTEYARMLGGGLRGGGGLTRESLWLAETPLFASTSRTVWPIEATRQAFSQPRGLYLVQ